MTQNNNRVIIFDTASRTGMPAPRATTNDARYQIVLAIKALGADLAEGSRPIPSNDNDAARANIAPRGLVKAYNKLLLRRETSGSALPI